MNNRKQRRLAVLAGGVVTLLGLQSVLAVAQEDDEKSPFSFSASETVRWTDNVFSLPDGFPSSGISGGKRGDTVFMTQAGVSFDKEYSRQGFHAGITATHSAYTSHSGLNNVAGSVPLRWDWRLGNRLSGVLGHTYSRSFVPFSETAVNNELRMKRLMRDVNRSNGSADYWWHPNWATGFGYSHVSSAYADNDDVSRRADKYQADQWSVNLTYRPSTGNRIVLSVRTEDGEYPNRPRQDPIRDWKRNDYQLSGQWHLSGVTDLSGYIGYTTREYDHAPERDFSGMTWKLGFRWTPTGKAIIDMSWRREIGEDMDLVSNFVPSQVFSFRPTWVATSKIRLGASYEYMERDYSEGFRSVTAGQRKYGKTMTYGANLQYLPTSSVNITLGYNKQKGDAPDNYYDFDAQTVWLSGSFAF